MQKPQLPAKAEKPINYLAGIISQVALLDLVLAR